MKIKGSYNCISIIQCELSFNRIYFAMGNKASSVQIWAINEQMAKKEEN